MADFTKMISALEAMKKKVDHAGFADRMTDPDFAEKVRQQLATKHKVQDSTDFYNTYNPAPIAPVAPKQDNVISQEEADRRNAQTGDAYTLGRNILTTAIAPVIAGAEYAKDRVFGESGWAAGQKPYKQYLQEHLEEGNRGEGLIGILGNPTNAMMAKLPLSISGVLGAGALGAGESVYHDFQGSRVTGSPVDQTQTLKNALIMGGITGSMHGLNTALSAGMKSHAEPYLAAERAYPAKVAEYKENFVKAVKRHDARLEALDDILKRSQHEVAPLREYNTEDEILGTLPGATTKQAEAADRVEEIVDRMMNKLNVRGIREHMYKTMPKYRELGGVIQPSDQDALEYLLKLKRPVAVPKYPEAPKAYELPKNAPGLVKAVIPDVIVTKIPSILSRASEWRIPPAAIDITAHEIAKRKIK